MSKNWLEIGLSVPSSGVDLVCACLNDIGSSGVIVEEKKLDTFVPPGYELESDRDYNVRAFFPEPENLEHWRGELECRLREISFFISGWKPPAIDFRWLADEAWSEDWKQHFHSFRVGDHLIFEPTWEESSVGDGDIVLKIDPGMAFGTGTHPTTRLCLEALDRILKRDSPFKKILDVGTGSGILAMAAAVLGAEKVVGCDIDETACEVARRNVFLNGLGDKIEISGKSLAEIEEKFDVVVANILAEENARLAPEFLRCLKKTGLLVLSGILVEKEALIENAFSEFSLSKPRITRLEDWSCFAYQKRE